MKRDLAADLWEWMTMEIADERHGQEICDQTQERPTWVLALLGLALSFAVSLLVLSPPSFRAWWIIEGTLLAFVTACVCAAVFWARRSLALVLLVAALSLIYLSARPGGWFYHKATPDPAWSRITYCDGGYYWRSAIALRSGENPFTENWYPPVRATLRALGQLDGAASIRLVVGDSLRKLHCRCDLHLHSAARMAPASLASNRTDRHVLADEPARL